MYHDEEKLNPLQSEPTSKTEERDDKSDRRIDLAELGGIVERTKLAATLARGVIVE